MSMEKHDYRNSNLIRDDVVVTFHDGIVDVWADDGEQHGIVGSFDNGRDASRFIWKNYHL